MANLMNYFARRPTKESVRDAIVGLRQQLHLLEKKEAHFQKKADLELATARANAVANKPLATAALKRKRTCETQLEALRGQQMQLQAQLDALESASFNAETVAAMKKAVEVMRQIQGGMSVIDVDGILAQMTEQREVAEEITELISNPIGGVAVDAELEAELSALENDVLTARFLDTDRVPAYIPEGARTEGNGAINAVASEDDDEETALRQIQAEMAAM
ncbi:vacuolar-sorting protein SNF7 [Mycena filopes]|nr:vacuolar-sorting protein SNF7 [Mycena filopes]